MPEFQKNGRNFHATTTSSYVVISQIMRVGGFLSGMRRYISLRRRVNKLTFNEYVGSFRRVFFNSEWFTYAF